MNPTERVRINQAVSIDRLGLGMVPLGNMFSAVSDAEAAATLEAWWARGLRTFDVAPVYGYGIAERRLGAFLAGRRREDFVVSTKVGRLLRRGGPSEPGLWHAGARKFRNTPDGIEPVFDFSAGGVEASLAESLGRLGLDRVDIVYLHDPQDHVEEAVHVAFPVLARLRDEGIVGAIGVGVGNVAVLERFARETDCDLFMLAGRYTLLDQSALPTLLPLCLQRGIAVISCSVFNGQVLADPSPGAIFDYEPAERAMLDRAVAIRGICQPFGVDMKSAALQYGFTHPAVTGIVVGTRSPGQVAEVVTAFAAELPPALWQRLEAELGIPAGRGGG